MKKRAMKKWIPKQTQYCYNNEYACKWRRFIKTIKYHRDTNCEHAETCKEECWTMNNNSCQVNVFKCEYLNYIDWNEDSLLFDEVKECSVSTISKEEYNFVKYRR